MAMATGHGSELLRALGGGQGAGTDFVHQRRPLMAVVYLASPSGPSILRHFRVLKYHPQLSELGAAELQGRNADGRQYFGFVDTQQHMTPLTPLRACLFVVWTPRRAISPDTSDKHSVTTAENDICLAERR
jgi:hypothetical protein